MRTPPERHTAASAPHLSPQRSLPQALNEHGFATPPATLHELPTTSAGREALEGALRETLTGHRPAAVEVCLAVGKGLGA